MPTPIIILTGLAGSGKSTVSGLLVRDLGFDEVLLAGPLKEVVKLIFSVNDLDVNGPSINRSKIIEISEIDRSRFWSRCQDNISLTKELEIFSTEQEYDLSDFLWKKMRPKYPNGLTVRECLQEIGTDWARKKNPRIWLDYALNKSFQQLNKGFNGIIVPDVRFRNEFLEFVKNGARAFKIHRPGLVALAHSSEQELLNIPNYWFDKIIHNEGSIQDLENEVRKYVK